MNCDSEGSFFPAAARYWRNPLSCGSFKLWAQRTNTTLNKSSVLPKLKMASVSSTPVTTP